MPVSAGLQPDPSAPPGTTQPARPSRRHLPRRILTWMLIVLFAILTPLTIASAWAVKTVTNTHRYVETLQPLSSDPVVTGYVADQATKALFAQLDVEKRIENLVPFGGAIVAAPLTAQLHSYTDTQVRRMLSSTWFQELWRKENTYTHATAVSILTGKNPPPTSTVRALVLNLTPAIVKAIDELDQKGVTIFNPLKAKLTADKALGLQLFSSKQVKTAQTFFNLAIDLRLALLIGTPLIGIAAVLVALERRRAALRVLLGGILGCLTLIALLTIVRSKFVSAVPPDATLFTQHLWDTLTRFLHETVNWVLAIFVIAVLGLWLTGSSTWAVATRRAVRGSSTKVLTTAGDAYHSESAGKAIEKATDLLESANAFVRRNQVPLRWVGVAVAGLLLLTDRTIGSVFWTLLLLGAYQLVISIPWAHGRLGPRRAAPADDEPRPDGG